jgi:homogentisate 1,2-dioxygenase
MSGPLYTQGKHTRQGHKGIPEGHFEEEQGLKGFFGPVSHLIRPQPSTRWVNIDGPLKPRLFDLVKLPSVDARQRLFYNSTTEISIQWVDVKPANHPKAFRNANADILYFCHKGSGKFITDYGLLNYRPGHYILMSKCVAHAIFPDAKTQFFVVENLNSHYEQPERGLVGRHAIYDPNAIVKPDLDAQNALLKSQNMKLTTVEILHGSDITTYNYSDCYFDVVGWKGDLYPYTLHVDDMMPLMSHRAHLPPSAHTTFVARDFVVCTFLPRPLETDADALKVPFYHQNIDYDEILFYHDGNFFSRDNLHAGMLSFHPAGFAHGPHPKAVKNIGGKTHTDEYAVMVDTRLPLLRDAALGSVELADYWKSWGAAGK